MNYGLVLRNPLRFLNTRVYSWRGRKLYAYLFFAGLVEDFCFLFWIFLASRGMILPVMLFVYLWSSVRDSYYSIPSEVWQDPKTRRFEKLGSALGAGLSLYLFPLTS
jgi:hypothetical protein